MSEQSSTKASSMFESMDKADMILGVKLGEKKQRTLMWIAEHPGASVGEIARACGGVSTATASRRTDALEALELIRKDHFGANGKEQCSEVTAKGRAYYEVAARSQG